MNVALCASLTAGNYMLPGIVSRFARTHPEYRFHVSIGNTEQVAESLLRFESDAGWVEGMVEDAALIAFPWREDPLVIVARHDHPLAGRKATIEQLAEAAWVLREKGSGTRAVFETPSRESSVWREFQLNMPESKRSNGPFSRAPALAVCPVPR